MSSPGAARLARAAGADRGSEWLEPLLGGRRAAAPCLFVAFCAGVALAALGAATSPLAMPVVLGGLVVVAAAVAVPGTAVVAFLLALPVGFVVLGPLQAVEAAALLTILAVVAGAVLRGRPQSFPSALGWGLALLVVAVLSFPGSRDEAASFRALAQLAGGVALSLAVATATTTRAALRTAVGTAAAVGAVLAVQAVATVSEQVVAFGGAVVTGRATGVFAQPNELGMVTAVLLCVAVGAGLAASSWPPRVAAASAAAVLLTALGLSLSRGAWLGAAGGVAALAVLLPAVRRRLLLVGVPLLAVAAALVVQFPDNPQVRVISDRLDSVVGAAENPYDDRPAILAEGLRQVGDRPLTGQGPGAFPAVAEVRTSSSGVTVTAEHAHNALLTVAAELGLPAVVLLLGLTWALASSALRAVRRALRSGRPRDAALYAGVSAALVVVAVHGLVDYPLRNAVGFLLVWAVAGLVVAADRVEDAVATDSGATASAATDTADSG